MQADHGVLPSCIEKACGVSDLSGSNVARDGAFRDIEQADGRSVDSIAVAATSAFASLQRPFRQDRAQLDLLIRPQIGNLSASALTNIAALLCSNRHAPIQLLHALAMLPVEICAPLLLRSPLLADDFLELVIREKGEAHRKVISKRADRRAPGAFTEEGVRRKLADLAVTAATKAPTHNLTWDELNAAVCVGNDVELAAAALEGAEAPDKSAILLSLAMSTNKRFLATHLADKLDVPVKLVASIMSDPASGEFTALLRATDTDTAAAMAIILILSRANLQDADRIRLLYSRYIALHQKDARAMVAGWKAGDTNLAGNRKAANGADRARSVA